MMRPRRNSWTTFTKDSSKGSPLPRLCARPSSRCCIPAPYINIRSTGHRSSCIGDASRRPECRFRGRCTKLAIMPARRSFEEQLAAIDELRQQPPKSALEPLRKALGHKNNYVVAKAADLARDFELNELLPELLAAFDRFFDDAI